MTTYAIIRDARVTRIIHGDAILDVTGRVPAVTPGWECIDGRLVVPAAARVPFSPAAMTDLAADSPAYGSHPSGAPDGAPA
jgi:hypothetical protein